MCAAPATRALIRNVGAPGRRVNGTGRDVRDVTTS
jgi:hypothetical protein